MSTPPGEFYTEDRWQNWLDRIKEEDIDPEDEDSARLLLNLQDDTAIAVVKVVTTFEDGDIDADTAQEEIAKIRDIVLADVEFENEEKAMLVDGVQTSLLCVFYAAEQFIIDGAAEEASIEEYILAAGDAEAEEDLDSALGFCVQAGTRIFDGNDLDLAVVEELEYGLVAEWVNGLDSLHNAMSDPEVVEEDDE